MSIKLTINAPGLALQAVLKDEALPQLVKLTQDHREDQGSPTTQSEAEVGTGGPSKYSTQEKTELSNAEVVSRLKLSGAAELLNLLRWETYPEKILLIGAWREARNGHASWRSADIDAAFSQAKETPPKNFPRDIRRAIKEGWIHAVTPRTYTVTRTGWNKIAGALKNGGGV